MMAVQVLVVLLGLLVKVNGQINCASEKVDLSIILDESSSVGTANFDISKQFLADLVSGANISSDSIQVAVITFATTAGIDINFDDYSNDKAGLLTAINGLAYGAGSGTNTESALDLAANTVFQANRRGERPDARNLIIILTDGMASNAAFLLQMAITAAQGKAEVFAVGVGGDIAASELQSIASDPDAEHVYEVATFETLMCIIDSLFTSLCPPCVVNCATGQICDRPASVCVTPVDECTDGTDNCDTNAACEDTPTSFECMCNSPFVGNGTVGNCIPPDPCLGNDCDGNATCSPSGSGFNCTCNPGFLGDGRECVVDPCIGNDCDGNATCNAMENGSFTCTCINGFLGDGRSCVADPCVSSEDNNCDVDAFCTGFATGGFNCTCNDGFFGDGTEGTCMACL
ncbi:transmembrane cell adhesion receptor mua-3-like isoform X1 [Haliotis rufescens]|uniref:transmembrane cell adhesion receptor mua-3-like isoform X1 n=1 Tax=Haliotis rufescens TaxID=6454 RepID=UPI001EAFD682|nr:transmembrane cell adhesion receptor mua-3-like isoform X1 [Haliotis rufescens]